MKLKFALIAFLILSSARIVKAADSDLREVDIIQLEVENGTNSNSSSGAKKSKSSVGSSEASDSTSSNVETSSGTDSTSDENLGNLKTPAITEDQVEVKNQENTLKDFSGLGKLAPFREVSVLQKRYLPKTGRVQFNLAGTVVTNDPFFTTLGAVLRAGYFFTETWGLEGDYYALTTSNRQTTTELKDISGVNTENLVFPKSYMGVNLVWVPIYGKLAVFNKNIVPFDLFFKGGIGNTQTQVGESASTFHLGTGQIFAFSKRTAFRWDFSWNFFNAKGTDGQVSNFNNLFLSMGASFFYPEAKYR